MFKIYFALVFIFITLERNHNPLTRGQAADTTELDCSTSELSCALTHSAYFYNILQADRWRRKPAHKVLTVRHPRITLGVNPAGVR